MRMMCVNGKVKMFSRCLSSFFLKFFFLMNMYGHFGQVFFEGSFAGCQQLSFPEIARTSLIFSHLFLSHFRLSWLFVITPPPWTRRIFPTRKTSVPIAGSVKTLWSEWTILAPFPSVTASGAASAGGQQNSRCIWLSRRCVCVRWNRTYVQLGSSFTAVYLIQINFI